MRARARACVCVCAFSFLEVTTFHRFLLDTYLKFDVLVLLSSLNEYVVFHATPHVFPRCKKNYIGRISHRSFPPPFPVFPHPSTRHCRLLLARRSFAARRGATNNGSHEFREVTRIGVELLYIGRRFPTLRQYGQMPPVILRLFALRRVVAL